MVLSEQTTLPEVDAGLSYVGMPTSVSFRYFTTSPKIIQLAVVLYVRSSL
jgi:hypothetical protein